MFQSLIYYLPFSRLVELYFFRVPRKLETSHSFFEYKRHQVCADNTQLAGRLKPPKFGTGCQSSDLTKRYRPINKLNRVDSHSSQSGFLLDLRGRVLFIHHFYRKHRKLGKISVGRIATRPDPTRLDQTRCRPDQNHQQTRPETRPESPDSSTARKWISNSENGVLSKCSENQKLSFHVDLNCV